MGVKKSMKKTGIEAFSMSKKQAQKEWKNYREVLMRRQDKYLEDMYQCFSHMKRGRKIIDVFKVIKKFGLNLHKQPKLAIARADWKTVIFRKANDGCGSFTNRRWNGYKEEVALPENTFNKWETEEESTWNIKNKEIRTKVPIIPAQFLPKGKLNNYYILWEVKKWEEVPKDPILLKRITKNLFAILAVWDLTPLEQSIVGGR